MLVRVAEPHDSLATAVATALRARNHRPILKMQEINSKDYLHDEAGLLNEDELADARAALIEDGLFRPEADLRATIKYAWAIAHAELDAYEEHILWSVADGGVTTEGELKFIVAEMQRRTEPADYLSLSWPVSIEPAVDFGEHADSFLRALGTFGEIIRDSALKLFIPHATGKFSVLPAVIAQWGSSVLLDLGHLGWMEAMRLLARTDAALFRRALVSAQEHFAFDKPKGALSTTEDDIHALPDVEDSDLERIFLDDARGRQLLHVTARSVAADLGEPLMAFLQREAAQLDTMIAAEIDRHFAG